MIHNATGLKFLLKSNQFLSVTIPPGQAADILRMWLDGSFLTLAKPRVGGTSTLFGQKVEWAVDLREVAAVHTFDVAEMEAAYRQQGQQVPPTARAQFQGNNSGVDFTR